MTPFRAPLTVSKGGCGFQTGAGAILNTLKPAPAETLLIFGLGSVGMTALMAAKYLGLVTIIAVDIADSKLELARELGATHVLNSKSQDILNEVRKITGRGASFAIDCTGDPSMIELLIECIHPFGTAGSIGDAPAGVKIQIDALSFMVTGKTFVGLVEGDSLPQKVRLPPCFPKIYILTSTFSSSQK
jgi:Zn-dependent alcohol dehydrogenase